MCVKVIGNLKNNNSKLYQHLTIKLHPAIDSTELINNIRGVINATIAQINYIIAQKNCIIAQKSYITAQNSYINARNNKIIAQNNNIIAKNNNTIANHNKSIANNTNAIAQNKNIIAKNKNIIAKNCNTIAEDEFSLVLTDTTEDTCTSFVYTLKCSDCRKYYVGRTHYGEQECFNEITTDETSVIYEHIQYTGHIFKIDDLQKVLSCCEYNKLRILESLLIKRYIVRDIGLLNIFIMKELTLFQYDEGELEKAERQLIKHTDRLGNARNNELTILEFSESHTVKVRRNYKQLILLQAEFENFYDKTQIFVKDDEKTKKSYIAGLITVFNNMAENCTEPKSWNKVVIGNIKYEENSCDGTVKSKQNNLVIKLPDIECSYNEFKKSIRELLRNIMEERYRVEEWDIPEDTRTSIIYLMKCKISDCDRKLYIGLTHGGKEKRFNEHLSDTKSAVYQHIRPNHWLWLNQGHGFNTEEMEILEVCCDHNKLRILESLYIKKYLLKSNKLLNKRSEEEQLALFVYTKQEKTAAKEFLNN